MRPVRLVMQAFGPYPGRQVIDFRDAVEAGLFGIYGQTGSGKSTIFSAMTFALFGEAARAEQGAPSLRSDHADADTLTEVEFVFDIGERRYVILRRPDQMRPKQRGSGETRDIHEAFLFDATGLAVHEITEARRGRIIAEKKVGQVGAAVADLLGYGSEQFRQIVLLPQGRFEAFLAAKTKDRLDVLRELFDVSLYRHLVTKMKDDAEEAERRVRQEREVCAGRLTAEGFESNDALAAGISEVDAEHAELEQEEKRQRELANAAQAGLDGAREIEARFKAAEAAEIALREILARDPDMRALAAQVQDAERARGILDVEERVADEARETARAAEIERDRRDKAVSAVEAAERAAAAHEAENARADEIEALRRDAEALERHGETLKKSVAIRSASDAAAAAERVAREAFDVARRKVETLSEEMREQAEALRTAREIEGRRHQLAAQLTVLETALKDAESFEYAGRDLTESVGKVARLTSAHELAVRSASEAWGKFENAERSLANVQALHLAGKLASGEPCPVCGGTKHPAPATGRIENVGLDKDFREAKAAWEQAQSAERRAEGELKSAQGVLDERQHRMETLARPGQSFAEQLALVETCRKAVEELGPVTHIADTETQFGALSGATATAESERDSRRDTLGHAEKEAASAQTRLDEALSSVPEGLRDGEALDAAIAEKNAALMARVAARDSVAKAATEAREAALTARKDYEAAGNVLSDCRERLEKAQRALEARLDESGLTAGAFDALKPAIGSIESDLGVVEQHRRRLDSAKDEALKAQAAIEGKERPDVRCYESASQQADDALTEATDRRARAAERLEQHRRLQGELAETLRRLDEAEVESGPLRDLAALFDAKNPQSLDLETFAIGALFDQVLEAANQRLAPMTACRYKLEREVEGTGRGRRGLGIQVFDFHTGKARPTATLSGGETFIAALALALGLADVVESSSGKVRLDTIFIDEGFGSLGTENGTGTLDQVLQVLSSLVSQNRAVGLISHVPLVQEAIPNGFYVRKELTGSLVETRRAI